MVDTMALIEDIVGLTPTKTFGSMVHGGGVTAPIDGVIVLVILGLRLLVVKYIVEVVVDEIGSSISKGEVVIPNVGLSGIEYGKGGVIPFAS